MNKKITDIGARSKLIFKSLVESYLKTGEPMGSKALSSKISYKLSPATIRNVLNEINFHGLIQKGHFSAGSIPTDLGLQFYTHALLEPGSISKSEKEIIEKSSKMNNLLNEQEIITNTLNGLSKQASLVINNEKISKIRKIDFHKIDNHKVIFIIEHEDGYTSNRIVEIDENIQTEDLNKSAKNQITNTSKKLLLKGIKIEKSQNTETFFVRGLPNLIKNNLETDLDSINELLSDIETGKMANKMIKALKKSKGVQIFIGSNTNFFKNTNLSMILSNYKTKNGLTGAIGVIGPKRIDYQRIVPIVSYMSETISKK